MNRGPGLLTPTNSTFTRPRNLELMMTQRSGMMSPIDERSYEGGSDKADSFRLSNQQMRGEIKVFVNGQSQSLIFGDAHSSCSTASRNFQLPERDLISEIKKSKSRSNSNESMNSFPLDKKDEQNINI